MNKFIIVDPLLNVRHEILAKFSKEQKIRREVYSLAQMHGGMDEFDIEQMIEDRLNEES